MLLLKYITVLIISVGLFWYIFGYGNIQASWYYEHTYECIIDNQWLTVYVEQFNNSKNCFEYIIELAGIRTYLYKQLSDINISISETDRLRDRNYLSKTRQIINQRITTTDKYINSIYDGVRSFEDQLFQNIRKKYIKSLVSVKNKIAEQNKLLYENIQTYIKWWDKDKLSETQQSYQQNYYKLVIINGILDATNLDEFMPMLDLYNEKFISTWSVE